MRQGKGLRSADAPYSPHFSYRGHDTAVVFHSLEHPQTQSVPSFSCYGQELQNILRLAQIAQLPQPSTDSTLCRHAAHHVVFLLQSYFERVYRFAHYHGRSSFPGYSLAGCYSSRSQLRERAWATGSYKRKSVLLVFKDTFSTTRTAGVRCHLLLQL